MNWDLPPPPVARQASDRLREEMNTGLMAPGALATFERNALAKIDGLYDQDQKVRQELNTRLIEWNKSISERYVKFCDATDELKGRVTPETNDIFKALTERFTAITKVISGLKEDAKREYTDMRTSDMSYHTGMMQLSINTKMNVLKILDEQMKIIERDDLANLGSWLELHKVEMTDSQQEFNNQLIMARQQAENLQTAFKNQMAANQQTHQHQIDHREMNLKEDEQEAEQALNQFKAEIDAFLKNKEIDSKTSIERFRISTEFVSKLTEIATKIPKRTCTLV